MADEKNSSELGITLTALGTGLLIVVCCAGPALIVGGTLGGLGGVLHNPWLIAAGMVGLLAAIAFAVHRQAPRDRRDHEDCCPPIPPSTNKDAQDSPLLGVAESQNRP